MTMTRDELLDRLRRLSIGHDGRGHRAPHKPLLLLWSLGRLQRTGSSECTFAEAEEPLNDLINEFGPPARKRRRANLPFYYLVSDGVWRLTTTRPDQQRPERRPLLDGDARGRLDGDVESLLRRDPTALTAAAQLLLAEHFTDALAPLITSAVGLDLDPAPVIDLARRRRRDPRWRTQVLHAWGYACAMCGFDGRLGTQPVALEAAHIWWHSQGGPDELDNGLALCGLHHALFDLGVLGLTLGGSIRVSGAFAATSRSAHDSVYALTGRPLRDPLPGRPGPADVHIAWHGREVFKEVTGQTGAA